jgi:hypothetical protein
MNNLKIAQTHSTNRKLIAYLVAKASLLALIVNACVVPAGLACIIFMLPMSWYAKVLPVIFLLIIGGMLAIVVDGMTLGACARLRKTYERRLEILNEYAKVVDPEPEIRQEKDQALESLSPSLVTNWFFVSIFSIVSIGSGELFWHTLLASLSNEILTWTLSSFFSIAVSATLIASELLKSQNEHVIAESIAATKFHAAAFNADAEEKAMSYLHSQFDTKVKELGGNAMIAQIVEEKSRRIYDNILFEGEDVVSGLIEAEASAKERAELERQRLVVTQRKQLQLSQRLLANGPDTGPLGTVSPVVALRNLDESEDAREAISEGMGGDDLGSIDGTKSSHGTSEIVPSHGTKSSPVNKSATEKHAYRILRKNPEMGPSELGRLVGISKSHASRLRIKFLKEEGA